MCFTQWSSMIGGDAIDNHGDSSIIEDFRIKHI